jgi:hypothetical protein
MTDIYIHHMIDIYINRIFLVLGYIEVHVVILWGKDFPIYYIREII